MDDQKKDHPDPERLQKETTINNYRHITGLPMMWKIYTKQIREIYYSLISRVLLSQKEKGCPKGTRGTVDLQNIDRLIFNQSKTRHKNLAMVWIDYKMPYDMAPKTWKIDCFKMYLKKISDKVKRFIEVTMKNWRVELTAEEKVSLR